MGFHGWLQGCLQLAQYIITAYVWVLLFENPWILTRNASMHFWLTRRSDKRTSYSYYALIPIMCIHVGATLKVRVSIAISVTAATALVSR